MRARKDILNNVRAVYFIGIGGIGMSALASYFLKSGIYTAGYDKVPGKITENLQNEGAGIHFYDDINLIPREITNCKKEEVFIVYTPAIPENHSELTFFRNNAYRVLKRAEVLAMITSQFKVLAIAGTHGKTSVSTIIAHIFTQSKRSTNAFLGGISKNYNSNLILSKKPDNAEFAITEADEYDRSFLKLFPNTAVVTAIDEDHLDIYKDIDDIKNTFEIFINQIDKKGSLVIKNGLNINLSVLPENVFTYNLNGKSDYYAVNIETNGLQSKFDIITPEAVIKDVIINIPGNLNIENVIASTAVADVHKISHRDIKAALYSWTGVKRRFEYVVNTPDLIYIDDYAHHPKELKLFISSVKKLYPKKTLIGIFQPHLYSRTRDFADEFARSLSLCDKLILTDIYPAREKPIKGVRSEIIFDKLTCKSKVLIKKDEILNYIEKKKNTVYMTMGAGDIDRFVDKIEMKLTDDK